MRELESRVRMGGGIRRRADERRASSSECVDRCQRRSLIVVVSLLVTAPVRSTPAAAGRRVNGHGRTRRTRVTRAASAKTSNSASLRSRWTLPRSTTRSSPKHAASRRRRPVDRSGSSRSSTRSSTGSVTAAGAARPGSRPTRAASGSAPVRNGRQGPARTPTSTSSPPRRRPTLPDDDDCPRRARAQARIIDARVGRHPGGLADARASAAASTSVSADSSRPPVSDRRRRRRLGRGRYSGSRRPLRRPRRALPPRLRRGRCRALGTTRGLALWRAALVRGRPLGLARADLI